MASQNPSDKNIETDGTGRPAGEHSSQTPPQILPAATVPQSPPSPNEYSEPQEKHRDWVDYTTMGLEMVGLVVLIAYTTFAALQWRANKQAAEAATEAAKVANATLKSSDKFNWRAQRAWILASAKHSVTFTGPVAMEVQLDNLGITEAKQLDGHIGIRIVKKGELADFSIKQWTTRIRVNLIVPKFHKTILVPALKEKSIGNARQVLTSEIAPGLKDGSLSMLIYGKLDYIDAWKIPHWIKFCDSLGAYKPGSNNPCADYNGTDDNEPQ